MRKVWEPLSWIFQPRRDGFTAAAPCMFFPRTIEIHFSKKPEQRRSATWTMSPLLFSSSWEPGQAKRIPGIPAWLGPALMTTVTKQAERRGGGGTLKDTHPVNTVVSLTLNQLPELCRHGRLCGESWRGTVPWSHRGRGWTCPEDRALTAGQYNKINTRGSGASAYKWTQRKAGIRTL